MYQQQPGTQQLRPSQAMAHHNSTPAAHDGQRSPLAERNGTSIARARALTKHMPGRLPAFARELQQQEPGIGPFSTAALTWKRIKDGQHYALVAAVPEHRLEDFLAGEGKRASTQVHLRVFKTPTDGITLNQRGSCFYSAPDKAHQRARQQLLPSEDAEPMLDGKRARKGALQRGTSCKMNCAYHFFAKAYAKQPGTIILKFPCGGGDTIGTCSSMQHRDTTGALAHDGMTLHGLKYTDEMRDFVVGKLKAHIKPAIIRAGLLSSMHTA